MNKPTLLLFGPLSRSLSQSNLNTLRTTILSSPQYVWAEKAISSLAAQYQLLASKCPDLDDAVSTTQIDHLATWLKTEDFVLDIEQLPNLLLAPLVVVAQLVQYGAYIASQTAANDKSRVEETAGFCIGLLSALAVALSHESPAIEFEQNAEAAVRLAMIAGAAVDKQLLQDTRGPSKTLSIAWKRTDSTERSKELEDILSNFPDVSISHPSWIKLESNQTRFIGLCFCSI